MQDEGRKRLRAPKLSVRFILAFVLLISTSVLIAQGLSGIREFANSTLAAQSADILPGSDNGSEAKGNTRSQQTGGQVSNQPGSSTPSCTKGRYRLPSTLNLSNMPGGLSIITDSPQQYTIYGISADEQRDQLQRCAPVDEFAGAASYQISWLYGYTTRADGLCEIVQPKIGLHLNMVMPHWSAGSNATTATKVAWESFITSLTNHEQGHYMISKHYAHTMLSQLKDLPPKNCATIEKTVDGLMQSTLAQLQNAQDEYDSSTDHGATQGATL